MLCLSFSPIFILFVQLKIRNEKISECVLAEQIITDFSFQTTWPSGYGVSLEN